MSRAVMTIHGYLTDDKDFGTLHDYLVGYDCVHRCIVPGHGEGADRSLFVVDSVLAHVTEQYDLLASKYDSVDVVGYSMGGALTSYLCAVRPVNRAVMLAPSNRYINISAIRNWILYLLRQMKDPLIESNGSITAKIKFTRGHLAQDLTDVERALGLAGNMLANITPNNYNTFAKLMKKCNGVLDATYEATGAIAVPTLIIMGGLDELVPHKSVEYVASRMSNATIVDITNMGHAMLRTQHEQAIVDMVVEHLQCATFSKEHVA